VASPLILQPDAAAGKDTFIAGFAATTNYATDAGMAHGDFGSGSTDFAHILIAFDLSAVPAGAVITSATLSLWEATAASTGGAPASWAVELRRVLRDWVEAQATWNIYSTGNAWGTAGANNDTDRVAAACASLTLDATAANGFVSWSSAGLVAVCQGWVDGTFPNYGLHVSAPALDAMGITPTANNVFHSSDYTTDAAKRPKLTLEYYTGAFALRTEHYARLRRG